MIAPTSEAALADAIRGADSPLRILGGGTRAIGRPAPGEAVTVSGLSGVTLYEPGALTVVAKAGTPMADLEATLAAENQRLAFEPMDHRALLGTEGTPTIGGAVAANVSGPRRVQVGACRDFLLGVRFVDGDGAIVKNGGRVMKNVTGYDLVKLMAGSYGTLGVLTEVSFKVLAKPETEATLVAEGLSATEAVAALCQALGSPFDVSGAAHVAVGAGRTQVRVEGLAASVAYRKAQLAALLPGFTAVEDEQSAALWAEVRNVTPFAGRAGAVWRVSVKPTDGPCVLKAVPGAEAILDWGGGLVWLLVPEERGDIRPALAGLKGHATCIRGAATEIPVFHPEPAPLAAITAGLRAKFDPRGVFNVGRMA